MLGFENLEESFSFIKTHKPELLSPLCSNLNQLSDELESLCYLLLDEQKKQWLTADDTSLEAFHDHALVLKDLYLELSEYCQTESIQAERQETMIQEDVPIWTLTGMELAFDEDWTGHKVVGYYFRNEWISVSSFKEIWIQLSSDFHKEYGSKIFKMYNSTYRKKTSPFFSTSSYEVVMPKKIPNTRFFASSAGQASVQKKIIQNLLDLTDYTVADLKIYIKR